MKTMIKVKIDKEIKRKVMPIFKSLGLNINDAINLFLTECLLRGEMPFEFYYPRYNKETIKAMKEAKKLGKSKTTRRYSSVEELFKSLNE